MKKFLFILVATAMFGFLQAQTQQVKKTTEKVSVSKDVKTVEHAKAPTEVKKQDLKTHVCTPACKDGKHVYKHGEKGHVCTKDCKAKMEKKTVKEVKTEVKTEVKK